MDFKSALNKICNDFNKDIIFERRVISILDDYGAFKDVPYYKLYYKTALSTGNLKNLISQNDNIRDKEIFTFVSITGLDENKTKLFLSNICECYYGIHSKPTSHYSENGMHFEDNRISSHPNNSKNTSQTAPATKGDNLIFMGKQLGCPIQEMVDYLLKKDSQSYTD